MTQSTRGTGTRRSRISPQREAELLNAVTELLREVGYEALTMDAVAARTRSGKATLYRQWHTKANLVATAVRHRSVQLHVGIDTGSLSGDLHEMVQRLAGSADEDGEILAALAHAVMIEEDLYQAVREVIVTPADTMMADLLARAAQRGEISAAPAAARFIPHMVIGALMSRPIVEGSVADAHFLAEFVDAILVPALMTPSASTESIPST